MDVSKVAYLAPGGRGGGGEIAALQSQLEAKRVERFELEAEARRETERLEAAKLAERLAVAKAEAEAEQLEREAEARQAEAAREAEAARKAEEVRKGEFKKKAALRRSMMSESERDLFAAAAAATNDPVGAALPAPWALSAIPAAAIVDSMMEEDAEVKAEMDAGGSAEHSPETQIATSKQAAGEIASPSAETLAPPPGRPRSWPRYTRLT